MKREPRTEVVSVRLTKAERERLDAMGGPKALRRALEPPPAKPCDWTTITINHTAVLWPDGTVGQTWPQSATSVA